MLRSIGCCFLVFLLVACAGKSQNRPQSQNSASYVIDKDSFERFRRAFEMQAERGEITWVAAATKTRDLDKNWASRVMFSSTWKYDSDDEEYHAFCIAMAERLDSKQITFAQYDAARIERMNAIDARRQILSSSQRGQISPTSSGVMCFLDRDWTSGLNKNCVYKCGVSESVRTVGSTQLCPLNFRQ